MCANDFKIFLGILFQLKNPCGFLKEIGETIFQKVDIKIEKKLKVWLKNPPNPRSHTDFNFQRKASLNFQDKIDSTRVVSFFSAACGKKKPQKSAP